MTSGPIIGANPLLAQLGSATTASTALPTALAGPAASQIAATVLAASRQSLVLAIGDQAWLATPAPALDPGAPVVLAVTGPTTEGWAGRLLSAGGQALDLALALRPLPAASNAAPPPPAATRQTIGVAVQAQPLDAQQQPVGAPLRARLVALPPVGAPADETPDSAVASAAPAGRSITSASVATAPSLAAGLPELAAPAAGTPAAAPSIPHRLAADAPAAVLSPAAGAGQVSALPVATAPGQRADLAASQPMLSTLDAEAASGSASISGAAAERGSLMAAALASGPSGIGATPLLARVTGQDALGRLLLQASGLTLRIAEPLTLPRDAQLQLLLEPEASHHAAATTMGDDRAATLRALVDLLAAAADPAVAERPDAAAEGGAPPPRLPEADDALAGRLLRLFQLLGNSAAEGTHGADKAAGSETDAHDVAVRQALAALQPAGGDSEAAGWRLWQLPVGAEPSLALRLFQRLEPEDQPEPEPEAAGEPVAPTQRVVFEIDFSALGRCQLDALCRGERFDLLVRTERPLDPALQQAIAALYADAKAIAGLTGELAFRPQALLQLPAAAPPGGLHITA